ncbi:MAG: prolipoprotein diacylglyceryl transferase [Elusimicrobiota bacterium]
MHPVLFSIGSWRVPTYGVLVAVAYLTAILWLKSQISDMPGMNEDKFWGLIYAVFFGAVLGGKILYIAVSWREFLGSRMLFLTDFRYGFVFFGGLLGALIAGAAACRHYGLPLWETSDYFGVALPLGHWIGRLGCLAAGCCYGKPTSMPWGVVLGGSPESVTPVALWGIPLHPTQLYESFCDLAIGLFLWRCLLPRAKNKELVPGTVFLAYVVLYSIIRFIIEFYRGDDRGWSFASLWVSQWIALGALAVAGSILWRRGIFKATHEHGA